MAKEDSHNHSSSSGDGDVPGNDSDYVASDCGGANEVNADSSDESLDDELIFNTFKKMVVKAVKRKSAKKDVKKQNSKSHKVESKKCSKDANVRRAFSRCNTSYFAEILNGLSQSKRDAIEQFGFSSLLNFEDCSVPRYFAQWIADHVDTSSSDIVVDGKVIPVSPFSVHMVLGIPTGGIEIKAERECGKSSLLQLFDQATLPSIKFFGNELLKENLSNDQTVRCFLIVALSTFLCPNSSTHPSTKYFGALVDVDKIKDFDWSKFVYDWLMICIQKYQKVRASSSHASLTLGGCIYFLAVYYLDFLQYGFCSTPNTIPRILVWRGDMIKDFSKSDSTGGCNYGKRPIKDLNQTCYGLYFRDNSTFRTSLERIVGNCLPEKVKDDITNMFRKFENLVDPNASMKAQELVMEIMEYLQVSSSSIPDCDDDKPAGNNAPEFSEDKKSKDNTIIDASKEGAGYDMDSFAQKNVDSQSTLKLPSDNSTQGVDNQQHINDSQSTIKLTSDESSNKIQSNDGAANVKNRKRKLSASQESNNSIASRTRSQRKYIDSNQNSHLSHSVKLPVGLSSGHGGSDKSASLDYMLSSPDINNSDIGSKISKIVVVNKHCLESKKNDDDLCTPKVDSNLSHVDLTPKAPVKTSRLLNVDHDPSFTAGFNFEGISYDKATINITSSSVHCSAPYGLDQCFDGKDHSNDVHKGTNAQNTAVICSPSLQMPENKMIESIPCQIGSPCSKSQYHTFNEVNKSIPSQFESSYEMRNKHLDEQEDPLPIAAVTSDGKVVVLSSQESQEVVFCGEKGFRTKFNNLCDESDQLYNQWISSNQSVERRDSVDVSSSYEQPRHYVPSRFVQPSRYKSSPYGDNRIRTSVSALELMHFDAIVRISDIENHKYRFAIDYGGVKVTFWSLGQCLKRKSRLDNYVVNAFCYKLFKDLKPSESKKHFFFHNMSEFFLQKWDNQKRKEDMIKVVQNSVKRANKFISHCDLLFFPSLFQEHWFVFVVDLKDSMFVFLDSFYNIDSAYHKRVKSILIPNFVKAWTQYVPKQMNFSDFDTVHATVPHQDNNSDCGVFVLKFMELWSPRVQLRDKFSHVDIANIRAKIANEMLFSTHNQLEDAKSLVRDFEPQVQGKYTGQM